DRRPEGDSRKSGSLLEAGSRKGTRPFCFRRIFRKEFIGRVATEGHRNGGITSPRRLCSSVAHGMLHVASAPVDDFPARPSQSERSEDRGTRPLGTSPIEDP